MRTYVALGLMSGQGKRLRIDEGGFYEVFMILAAGSNIPDSTPRATGNQESNQVKIVAFSLPCSCPPTPFLMPENGKNNVVTTSRHHINQDHKAVAPRELRTVSSLIFITPPPPKHLH